MLEVAVSAYNVVETLGSTETSRSHANNEDIDVTGEEQKSVNSVVRQESISKQELLLLNRNNGRRINSRIGHGGGIR